MEREIVEEVVLATEPYSSFCGSCAQGLLIGNVTREVIVDEVVEDEERRRWRGTLMCEQGWRVDDMKVFGRTQMHWST